MRSPFVIAALAAIAMLSLGACTTTGEIEGHKVRATGETSVVKTKVIQPDVHRRAPQWFKDYWAQYLGHLQQGYAVMAVDRRLRGMQYVYCGDPQCYQLRGAGQHRGWKDVQYRRRALNECREIVQRDYPSEKPACAVYAIGNKIVWKGQLPWE